MSLPLIVLFACLACSVAQAREQASVWQTPSAGAKETSRQRASTPLRRDFAQAPVAAFPGASQFDLGGREKFGLSGRERAQLRDQIRNAAHDIYTQERKEDEAIPSDVQP